MATTRPHAKAAKHIEENVETYHINIPTRAVIEAHNGVITGGDFLFLCDLCATHPQPITVYAGSRTISKMFGMLERTAAAKLRRLENLGYIIVLETRPGSRGRLYVHEWKWK